MNNNYYPNYQTNGGYPNQEYAPTAGNTIFNEQSYIENILRVNKGKRVSVYQSFADSGTWKDKVFNGIIEQSGRDHIILSDPQTGKWYLLLMIYVNFIEFDEPINVVGQFYPSKL